jgi:hypothetical protein
MLAKRSSQAAHRARAISPERGSNANRWFIDDPAECEPASGWIEVSSGQTSDKNARGHQERRLSRSGTHHAEEPDMTRMGMPSGILAVAASLITFALALAVQACSG